MKQKITQTDDYLLLVSDKDIKEEKLRFILDNRDGMNGFIHQVSVVLSGNQCPEITAHYPLNGAPLLDRVPLLPELTKVYSEHDVIDLMIWAEINGRNFTGTDIDGRLIQFKNKIKSFGQPKAPKLFISEMINFCKDCGEYDCFNAECAADIEIPKTTTNKHGQIVLIGTYEY